MLRKGDKVGPVDAITIGIGVVCQEGANDRKTVRNRIRIIYRDGRLIINTQVNGRWRTKSKVIAYVVG